MRRPAPRHSPRSHPPVLVRCGTAPSSQGSTIDLYPRPVVRYYRRMVGRASAQAALETRRNVLKAAADLASVEGLDSVTIGRLADVVQMSKSGVIGQFRNKETLQLETVNAVFAEFRTRVWDTVKRFPPGLPRLLEACDAWVEYAADSGFPGGCLMTQMTYDYDGRGGAVHDLLAEGRDLWRDALRADIRTAVEAGDLPPSTDVETVVFALESLVAFITPARLLHGDADAGARAVSSMRRILGVQESAS
jgi:AcrR family transcriptional regulator